MYKVDIISSNYLEWKWYHNDSNVLVENNEKMINPLEYKLFSGDVINENNEIIHSETRNNVIPGILLVASKTYGRNKNGKLNYKCIPNVRSIPSFLIPYEEKNIGFGKNLNNKFVLFKYVEWIDKHPIGIIVNTIGDITNLKAFYEYQLYCNNLFLSIKEFTNTVNKAIKSNITTSIIDNIMQKNKNIENRLHYNIFTIDPKTSTDLDDGMGLKDNILSIYIANVPLIMEYFNLWNSFSERISTIYLPDKKRQMLPPQLSENLCSLLENENRFAFCMDIEIDTVSGIIKDIKLCNVLIKVKKNYRYNDTEEYENTDDYKKIITITKGLCKNYRYVKEIKDSHDLVEFLMILMNCEMAKLMTRYKAGIYRTFKIKEYYKNNTTDTICSNNSSDTTDNNGLSNEILNFIKIWQSSSGEYTDYNNKDSHDLISNGIENYIHITSPIRRLVDLLNILKLQELIGLIEITLSAKNFYTKWINRLEYINTSMRAIRKVQQDCNILDLCINYPDILEEIYDGYIFDKILLNNNYLEYTVYIPKIKIVSRVTTKSNIIEYSCLKFKLYLIEDEITLKRKIRVEIQN